jgi:hypothetical protein
MAGELYRTYEVLVEESVVRDADKDPKTKKDTHYNPEIAAALRDTNEIFQHAVCYYTLLLAGLVRDAKDPKDSTGERLLNPLWQHLRSGGMRQATDALVRRLAERYERLTGVADAESFLDKLFIRPAQPGDGGQDDALAHHHTRTYILLEDKGTERDREGLPTKCTDLATLSSTFFRRFCDPDTTQQDSTQEVRNNNYFAQLHTRLAAAKQGEDSSLAKAIDLRFCMMTPLRETSGEEALRDYLAAFRALPKGQPKWVGINEVAGKLEIPHFEVHRQRLVAAWGPQPVRQPGEKAEVFKARLNVWREKVKKFPLNSYAGKKPNQRLWFCLRYRWCQDEESRCHLLEFKNVKDCKFTAIADGERDALTATRLFLGGKNLFPYFTALLSGGRDSLNPAFDVSAFAAAAEDLFKYKIRTQDRKRRYDRFSQARDAYQGVGATKLDAKRSHTGKPVTILGMGDDPRAGKMDKLLSDLASKLQFVGKYGLRPGTIGGWADLRKTFRQLERKAEKEKWADTRLVGELQEAVETAQRDNPDGFGSAAFFEMLCESEFHCLWSAKLPTAGNRERHAADFVRYYVGYSEVLEEIQALEEIEGETKHMAPIRFTWPGTKNRRNKTSYRHFDFKQKLGTELKGVRLFRKLDRGKDNFPAYELREDDTLTLAARRLKRDRVMTADGSVVEALWCPPLALENANDSEAGKRVPKIGKTKKGAKETKAPEISFSLMVSDPEDDGTEPPTYLKVAIPITPGELNRTLRLNKLQWAGSLAWDKEGMDFIGKHLQWPVDLRVRQAAKVRALAEEATSEELKSALEKAAKALAKGDRKAVKLIQTEIKQLAMSLPEADAEVCKDAGEYIADATKPLWCGDADKKIEQLQIGEQRRSEFHALSVDLNVRFAAAYARLRVFVNDGNTPPEVLALSRRLAPGGAHATDIRAHAYAHATLRLSGEDAHVWTKTGKGVFELRPEDYGKKGRLPVDDPTRGTEETKDFLALADALVPLKSLPVKSVETLSVPEMGDVLIRRLQRRLSRIKSLFKLRWRIMGLMERNPDTFKYDHPRKPEDQKRHRREVVTLLGRLAFRQRQEDESEHPDNKLLRDALNRTEDDWKAISERLDARKEEAEEKLRCAELDAAVEEWDWAALGREIQKQLDSLLDAERGWENLDQPLRKKLAHLPHPERAAGWIELLALLVVEHCLPLRKRHWHWKGRRLKKPKEDEAPGHVPMIRGARGLSVARLEQVSQLRQAYQSLAKQLKRYHDYPQEPGKPGIEPTPTERAESVDDCCEPLLDKRNQLREERVNQIAHMILAEALGLELEDPAKATWEGLSKREAKSACDLHGRYRHKLGRDGQPLPRCDLIVLEDLSRYRTSQDRARSENSQLMNWCHRAVVEKLRDIARPFGITIVTVGAAYSSRFHSLSGLPGVRVNHVSREGLAQMPYAAWAKQTNRNGKPSPRAAWIGELLKLFAENPGFHGELLMPVDGGKEFLPIPRDGEERATHNGLKNADENAAINIGLRALAHPDSLDIFTRIQTKAQDEQTLRVRNRRGWFAELAAEAEERSARCANRPDAEAESSAAAEPDEPEDDGVETAAYPNLFVIQDGTILLPEHELYRHERFVAARYGPYWGRVRNLCEDRIRELNSRLLQRS